jgi:hypothetical protein
MLIRDLFESPSLPSTLNAIATDLSTKILPLYRELDVMLDRMLDKTRCSNNFPFVGGSVKSRWMNDNWNKFLFELFDLGRQSGTLGSYLLVYLNKTRPTKFNQLTEDLPPHLKRIAAANNDKRIENLCNSWLEANLTLEQKIRDNWCADEDNAEIPAGSKSKTKSTLPQQNVQAEKIVNDVLNKLPSGVAGDIRNALARSTNKIQDLMRELARRGITPPG